MTESHPLTIVSGDKFIYFPSVDNRINLIVKHRGLGRALLDKISKK